MGLLDVLVIVMIFGPFFFAAYMIARADYRNHKEWCDAVQAERARRRREELERKWIP